MARTSDASDWGSEAIGRFWDYSASGFRVMSRPIVLDGLLRERLLIEIPSRVRIVGGRAFDASHEAVDSMARALGSGLSVEQLALTTVAVRIHLRRGRAHLERSHEIGKRWKHLARRAREAGEAGEPELRSAWEELEAEERDHRSDGRLFPREDLAHPFILNLVRASADLGRPRERTSASAMQTLVEAVAETLSRTDLAILEIALRRGIRGQAPVPEEETDAWERELLRSAEEEYVAEFPWAAPYRSGGPASGELPKAERK